MCLASFSFFFLSLIFWIFLPTSHDFSSFLAINSPKFLNFLYLLIFENVLEKGVKTSNKSSNGLIQVCYLLIIAYFTSNP
jgi:hypothetical protein